MRYNYSWIKKFVNTLKIPQSLDMISYVDNVSGEGSFLTIVNCKKFAVIPCTIRNNDIVNFRESGKRIMMSVISYIIMSYRLYIINILDRFLEYTKQYIGVTFVTKKDIAELILNQEDEIFDTNEDIHNR